MLEESLGVCLLTTNDNELGSRSRDKKEGRCKGGTDDITRSTFHHHLKPPHVSRLHSPMAGGKYLTDWKATRPCCTPLGASYGMGWDPW